MIQYFTGTTYFTVEQITRLVEPAWMGPQQYLVEVQPVSAGQPYLTFVSMKELAPVLFPRTAACPACHGLGYTWQGVGWEDDVEKLPCEGCR